MKIKTIYEYLVKKFKGDNEVNVALKNGRIIISMKQEKNVWTKEQENDLDKRFNKIESKIDKLIDMFENHIKQDHK